jgi:hypothetical protein
MDRSLAVYETHAQAEAANKAYYRSLTPNERVVLLLELIAAYRENVGEAAERFERVCRVIALEQS